MSVERSFEAWEEVQRHGQDLADKLAQGFTGLLGFYKQRRTRILFVKKGNVSPAGKCLSCSVQLACVDTDEVETQKFVDSLVALALERKAKINSCGPKVDFREFQDWLEKHGDYEAIIDGANIGPAGKWIVKKGNVSPAGLLGFYKQRRTQARSFK